MSKSDLIQLAQQMPKAELHLHLEGSLEPERVFQLAERNQVRLAYPDVASLKAAYQFDNLQAFLDVYYAGMSVLQKPEDFFDLTWDYLQRARQDQVAHVEVFFDPQAHLERNISLDIQIEGIHAALEEGRRQLDISYRLIPNFLRHLPEEDALRTLDMAEPFYHLFDGFGLDSSEVGHPPHKFQHLFARCRALGFKVTAHAGEEGPPEYIYEALDLLQVDRIDHGNRALEDEALIQRLVDSNMTLTVCPLSNLKLKVVPQLDQHPLVRQLQQGLKVTVNSDDPAYFGGYVNDNFRAVIEQLPLTREHLYTLARNSFTGAWLDQPRRTELLQRLNCLFRR